MTWNTDEDPEILLDLFWSIPRYEKHLMMIMLILVMEENDWIMIDAGLKAKFDEYIFKSLSMDSIQDLKKL